MTTRRPWPGSLMPPMPPPIGLPVPEWQLYPDWPWPKSQEETPLQRAIWLLVDAHRFLEESPQGGVELEEQIGEFLTQQGVIW
jgi:hypothetical protein